MKQTMIVTNIRMPEEDLAQVKAAASDMGMSFNQYVNHVVQRFAVFHTVATMKMPTKQSYKRLSIWDLPTIAKHIKRKPMGLSAEDRIIYGE